MVDVAVVCGAAGALGQSVVSALVARGDRVVAVDRHGGRGSIDEAGDGSVRGETVDLTSPADVEALWERLQERGERPRWLVNMVGGFRGGSVAETEPEQLRFLLDLNLGTTWWSCRTAARRMRAGDGIVNVAARAALTGGTGSAAYAVAKAGVVRLTQVLAAELADTGVRVNVILPSVMDTAANRDAMTTESLRRAVPTADVAAVAAFLCSDAAEAISGAAIPAYGKA